MAQTRTWDYGAPRRTLLLNSRYLDVIPSRCVIAGFEVSQTSPASLSLNISAGVLISQDGVVVKESEDLIEEVVVEPDLVNPRIDWVVADHTYSITNAPQTYYIVQGTAGTPPSPPSLPDHTVKLAEIYVLASATAIGNDSVYNVPKTTVDSTLLNRLHLSELQPVSTSEHSTGISDKVLVRGGTYNSSDGSVAITVSDQLSPSFNAVTYGTERIDLLVINDNGTLYVIEGIEDVPGYAVAPTYPTDMMTLAEVTVNESTYEVLISSDDIRDVRPFLNLGGGGGGGGGGTLQLERYDFTATGGQTVVNLPFSYSVGKNQLLVISSGTTLRIFDDYLESSITSITFTSGRVLGELVSVIRIGAAAGSATTPLHEKHIATGGQTIFTLTTGTYVPGANSLVVIRNGKILTVTDDYTETDETTVTLSVGAVLGDVLLFKVIGATGVPVSDLDVIKNAYYNLSLGTDATTPNTIIRIDANCIVGGTSGAFMKPISDVTINSGVFGAGGLDHTLPVTPSTWYAIYLISTDLGAVSGILSTNFTSPSMPSGYTNLRRVGAVYVDSSSYFRKFKQVGNTIRITDNIRRVLYTTTATVRTWYSTNLDTWVPTTMKDVDFVCILSADDIVIRMHHNNTDTLPIANETVAGLDEVVGTVAALELTDGSNTEAGYGRISRMMLPTRNVYWYRNNSGGSTSFSYFGLMLDGYTDNI